MDTHPEIIRIGNDIVACFAVVTPEGVTLVDAGLPGHLRQLEDELASRGRSLADVRGIVLTHGDSDHIGFAERLRSERDVPVYVHEADAARARGEVKGSGSGGAWRIGAALGFFAYALGKGGARSAPIREVHTVVDGDVLDLPGAPEIIGLPGHSPGSVAVRVPAVDAIFLGDAVTTRNVLTGRTGPAPAPFTDDPAFARRSLARLSGLPEQLLLPGHGPAFVGTPADLIARLTDHGGV